mgnify:CR=1 FL=1
MIKNTFAILAVAFGFAMVLAFLVTFMGWIPVSVATFKAIAAGFFCAPFFIAIGLA